MLAVQIGLQPGRDQHCTAIEQSADGLAVADDIRASVDWPGGPIARLQGKIGIQLFHQLFGEPRRGDQLPRPQIELVRCCGQRQMQPQRGALAIARAQVFQRKVQFDRLAAVCCGHGQHNFVDASRTDLPRRPRDPEAFQRRGAVGQRQHLATHVHNGDIEPVRIIEGAGTRAAASQTGAG